MKSLLLVNPVLGAISEIDHSSLSLPLVMGLWRKEYRQTSLSKGNRQRADRDCRGELIELEHHCVSVCLSVYLSNIKNLRFFFFFTKVAMAIFQFFGVAQQCCVFLS